VCNYYSLLSLNLKCSKMKLQCNVSCRTIAYSNSFFGRFNFCGRCCFSCFICCCFWCLGFYFFLRLLFVTLFVLVFKTGQSYQNALDPGHVNREQYRSSVVDFLRIFPSISMGKEKVGPYQGSL